MPTCFEIIANILHLAFNVTADSCCFPSDFDWKTVSDTAIAQGVCGLFCDGIQKSYNSDLEYASFFEADKSIKYDLFGQCLLIEKDYAEQWKYANEFADGLDEYGIRLYVLKGFTISSLYPVPEHRPCCDLDCYLVKDQSLAYDDGNKAAVKLGYKVRDHYYKHSKIKVGTLMVENHQFCLPIKGDPRSKRLNEYLFSIIDDGESRYIENSKLLSPSPMFNAIYILAHAREHFFNEGIMLRHICDWACIMRSFSGKGIEFWNEWKERCSSFGLMAFGYSMSRLAKKICGTAIPFDCPSDEILDEKVLADVFRKHEEKKRGMVRRVQLVRNLLSSRWKFREFSDRSAYGFVFRRVWGYLVEKDPA